VYDVRLIDHHEAGARRGAAASVARPRELPMRRRVLAAQNISRMCLVCGTENRAGLKARFYELDGGELLGVFRPLEEHQSYPGRLHGGIASAILDETIGRAIMIAQPGTWGVTAELTLRYRKPVPLGGDVTVVARITRDAGRLFEGTGEIRLADGSVAVEASGKYLRMPLEDITEAGLGETEWYADERDLPAEIDL
jgi:acyl-coenzyme A thioesterase PaaI-like protein